MRLFIVFVGFFFFSATFTAVADGDGTRVAQNIVSDFLNINISEDTPKVTAVLEAEQAATLSAGIKGKIDELPFRQGEPFKKGATLLGFDCDVEKARFARAKAKYDAEKVNYEAHRKLAELRSVASVELAIAKADMAQAKASMAEQNARIKECKIKAPFDGAIVERPVNLFETVEEGAPVLRVISTGTLEVRMLVPSEWLVWLKKGQKIVLEVNETKEGHEGVIEIINAAIDPVSRLVEVTAKIEKTSPTLKAGMTGVAYFAKEEDFFNEPIKPSLKDQEGQNTVEEETIRQGELTLHFSDNFGLMLLSLSEELDEQDFPVIDEMSHEGYVFFNLLH